MKKPRILLFEYIASSYEDLNRKFEVLQHNKRNNYEYCVKSGSSRAKITSSIDDWYHKYDTTCTICGRKGTITLRGEELLRVRADGMYKKLSFWYEDPALDGLKFLYAIIAMALVVTIVGFIVEMHYDANTKMMLALNPYKDGQSASCKVDLNNDQNSETYWTGCTVVRQSSDTNYVVSYSGDGAYGEKIEADISVREMKHE